MWGVTFYSHILIRIWNCSDSVVYFVFHVSYTNRRFSGCLCLIHLYNGFYMDRSLTQTRTFWPSSVFLLSCHFGHLQCSCYPVYVSWLYCSQNFNIFDDVQRTCWWLFQKRVVRTKFDIYVFIYIFVQNTHVLLAPILTRSV